jgi:hypothetical protein
MSGLKTFHLDLFKAGRPDEHVKKFCQIHFLPQLMYNLNRVKVAQKCGLFM